MMARKKILVIENAVDVTGSFVSVLRAAVVLKGTFEFIFILPRHSKVVDPLKREGFQYYQVPLLELSKRWQSIALYLPYLIRSTYLIRRIAKAQRVAAVHVNDFYNLNMPAWKLFGGRVPYLCYVNFVPNRFPFLLRKLWIGSHLLFAAKLITVSRYVLHQLPVDIKTICIPCALPSERTIPPEAIVKRKILLFLGNYIEGKGQDLAIVAFALIADQYPEWKLRFVGGDMGTAKNRAYHDKLQQLSRKLSVDARIEWSSFSNNVVQEYRGAAIALNFSRSESFSLTVQEAMFYGCPVIATRSGGPAELIDDGYSGLLVPLDDIAAMRMAMERLLGSSDERKRLETNAAKSIREKFDRSKTIDQLGQAYHSISS